MLQELIIKETVHALTFRVFLELVILYTIDSKQNEGYEWYAYVIFFFLCIVASAE